MSDQDKHRARIYFHRGNALQARASWEAAVADDRVSGTPRELSSSLGDLENGALAGDFETAEQCYREVLAIQRTERDQHAVAHTLVNLGNLHVGAGRPEKARPYYLEALDLLTPLNDHRALGILHHNLALEEARQNHWDQAVNTFKLALDEHHIMGAGELAITYSQLGKTFLDSADLLEAERCFNNASEHFIKLGNEAGEAACLRMFADIYRQRGSLLAAVRCLERVVSVDSRYQLPSLREDGTALDSLLRQELRPDNR